MTSPNGMLLGELLIAAVCGGAIGLQRQAAQKPAGFRTHVLVALGCCAFAEIGRLTGDTRIAANVLTGIGFIGAGAIFRSGITAHGLTTAASIWAAAAVGVGIAQGQPEALAISIGVTILTVVTLSISDGAIERLFVPKTLLSITYAEQAEGSIRNIFKQRSARYAPTGDFVLTNAPEGRIAQATYRVFLRRDVELGQLIEEIAAVDGVRTVAMNEPTSSS